MKLYGQLSSLRFLNTYSAKFLFVAFIGIHIPLIGLIAFLILNAEQSPGTLKIVGILLLLTLIATTITLFLLHSLIAPIRTAQNALQGYLGYGRRPQLPTHYSDEMGQLLRELQLTMESLDGAIQEKQDLIGMLSHDLRSPANSIHSMAYLIRQESDRKIIEFYCDQIERLSASQLDLMESMLFVLRNESSPLQKSDYSRVRLKGLVDKAMDMVSLNLQTKDITMHCLVDESVEIDVEPVSFGRVLVNLLDNAIKFSYPEGFIRLECREQAGMMEVSLTDRGVGFHPTDAPQLFTRFTTLGKKGTRGEPSNGIGLYLCKQIVERHDGSMEAFSEGPGRGATFLIRVPIRKTEEKIMA